MSEEAALQPECYKRHERMESHIAEGTFWRGVIITAILAGVGILIAQFNIANANQNIMIAANAKLTTMVEVNTARLLRLETKVWAN
jgi:hypothetical protein